MNEPRKPDYRLKAMNKATAQRGTVGAAWVNPDGTVSITLHAFTVLPSTKDMVYTLFPCDSKEGKE